MITKGNFGGAQRYVADLVLKLKDDYDITVAHGEGADLSQRLSSKGIKTVKVEGLGRNMEIFGDMGVLWKIYKLIREIKPDILHLNSPKAAGLGSLAGKFARVKKIIITIHGFSFKEDRPFVWIAAIKTLSWVTLCLATDAIFVCKADKEIADKWLFKPKNHLIHNGVEQKTYLSKENSREKLGKYGVEENFWKNKKIVGTIAELHKNKGLIYALRALEKLPNVGYVIIGEGEEREKLEQEILRLNLTNRVRLTGFIPEADSLLKAFDIFLLPSVKEGLPYVLIEAAAANLPIIASDTGGIKEILAEKFLVQPKSPREIETKIRKFLSEEGATSSAAAEIHKTVSERFSLESMIKNTERVYLN